MPQQLREGDREWFESLLKEVRTVHKGRFGGEHWFGKRTLTQEEWDRVTSLIREHELPCILTQGPYGFGFAVYDHHDIPGVIPELVFWISYDQIPDQPRGFEHQEDAARNLSEMTHSTRNVEILDFYGFRPQRSDPAQYAY